MITGLKPTSLFTVYLKCLIIVAALNCVAYKGWSQTREVSDSLKKDSLHKVTEALLLEQQKQQHTDSIIKIQLEKEIELAAGDKEKTRKLEEKLKQVSISESISKAHEQQRIETLRKTTTGIPVAPFSDTLFYVYTKIGSFTATERAAAITERIRKLYNDPFYQADSLKINETENGFDIMYNDDRHILSVSNLDALWLNKNGSLLANQYLSIIKKAVSSEKDANSITNWLKRIGMAALIISGLSLLIFLINWLFKKLKTFLALHKEKYFSGLTIRK